MFTIVCVCLRVYSPSLLGTFSPFDSAKIKTGKGPATTLTTTTIIIKTAATTKLQQIATTSLSVIKS